MSDAKQCIILRGAPGSGKSTFANATLVPKGAIVCSADDYFTRGGRYDFRPAELGIAHQACLSKFLTVIQAGHPLVVVDNTNIHADEIAPYYALAELFGYLAIIYTFLADPSTAAGRNIHGVPAETVLNHCIKLGRERLPGRWRHSTYRLN